VFAAGSTTPVTLAGTDFSQFLVSKVNATTLSARIMTATRLKSAEMWYQYGSQGTGGSAPQMTSHQPGFNWPSTNTVLDNPQETKSSVVLGVAEPGYVKVVPPKGSLAAAWHDESSSLPVLTIDTASAQWAGVVDIVVEFTLSDAEHPSTSYTGASASSTSLGQASFTGLQPVGYQIQ